MTLTACLLTAQLVYGPSEVTAYQSQPCVEETAQAVIPTRQEREEEAKRIADMKRKGLGQ